MNPEFSAIQFDDPARAEANLERLEQLLPPALGFPLTSLLGQSPDPDGALNLIERYAGKASPEARAELAQAPTALTYLIAIFGFSGYLAETFLTEPGLPLQFARDKNFTKLKSREDLMQDYARFSTTTPDLWLSAQLGRFKRRTTLRIVLKDVLGTSTLAETTLELSELADVILINTLAFCEQELRKRYGEPQYRDAQGRIGRSGFSVISLGKMGGNELNYSSDIDLLFLYSHDGETSGGSEPDSVISNKEYFVRLANAITRTITQSTPHGQVFRVDLRLRPEGDQGDMTISLRSALEYYEHRARDWELQMLIKARHSAGDEHLTRQFLRGVEPFIYSAPADFAAIETVLLTRERISKKIRMSRNEGIDVKRHRGGIRDIEFLTQCLQRLHGGHDHWVRSGGTLLALRKLNDKGWLSDKDYAALTSAYEFLRKVEHRIQLDRGQQTHRLPEDADALNRLARRIGADATGPRRDADAAGAVPPLRPAAALTARLEEIFKRVDAIYQKVIHPGAASETTHEEFLLKPPSFSQIERVGNSYEAILEVLSMQAPVVAEAARQFPIPDRARKNAARFMGNLLSSSEGFHLAREHPAHLARALEVISASDYFAEQLIHHPGEMMALDAGECPPEATTRQLVMALPSRAGAESCCRDAAETFPWMLDSGWDLREQMAALRRYFQTQRLVSAERDIVWMDSLFQALGRWSVFARRSIATALAASAEALRAAPGPIPPKLFAAPPARLAFAVLGLGRLGIQEFDFGSDADLIFVVPRGTPEQEIEGWTHLAGKIIDVLSSYTSEGTLFAVDARLRPQGQEGELVVTEDALLDYLSSSAKVWEGLAYLKASFVAGNPELGRQVAASIQERAMARFGDYPDLEGELRQMRQRLERELAASPSDPKDAPGGYYDVDYALSYLRLRRHLSLQPGRNTVEQIQALSEAGCLRTEDASVLERGARFLRSVDHAVRLVTGKPAEGLPEHVGHAAQVEELLRRWGEIAEKSLVATMDRTQREIRHVYGRLAGTA